MATTTPTELMIGELADRSGVTVRALRHYEHVGLLEPSHRTANGHRRYGAAAATGPERHWPDATE